VAGPRTILGLDLGQSADFSALACLRECGLGQGGKSVWECPLLKRWPLGTSYPDLVRDVATIVSQLDRPELVVDATGVGRPVFELFAEARLPVAELVAVVITAGHASARSGPDSWSVPKRTLVASMQTLLQPKRLKIAKTLPDAAALLQEMMAFRVKVNPDTGHESFEGWKSRDKDDLVLAVCLAAWQAQENAPVDWNVRHLKLTPGPSDLGPPRVVYDQVRYFPPTDKFQPMPTPGGELIQGCPDFRTQPEAAYFVRRLYAALGLEPPDLEIDLDAEALAAVESSVNDFIRTRRLRPAQ
jgi:hypothetical protein